MITLAAACNGPIQHRDKSERPGKDRFPVLVELPHNGSIATGAVSPNAQILRVGCESCHSLRQGVALPKSADELDEFHVGLTVTHGELSCASCHNPAKVNTFRLADGRTIEYPQLLQLCGQCHGTQMRDYRRGAHGGMTGYWDRSRGPRTRKICTDCHDPHAPAYVGGDPVAPPRDRFLEPAGTH